MSRSSFLSGTFNPIYRITDKLATTLLRLEGAKERINALPITPTVLAGLRQTTELSSTHYSTLIEGNRMSEREVEKVIENKQHFPGRERDEKEVKGYFRALAKVEALARKGHPLAEDQIQNIHGFVMGAGKRNQRPTPYRTGQNVIKDSLTGRIVYLPPEAKDVPALMASLVDWLNRTKDEVPCPIRAAMAHYQFATVHPYYDGNGRTARLLTNLVLHIGGYGLKGIYSLEEYYATNLQAYYAAIAVGPSHNYYLGRAKAEVTGWLDYFIEGVADAIAKVEEKAKAAATRSEVDTSAVLRNLDPRQRNALTLFAKQNVITSGELAGLFNFAPRTARSLLQKWTPSGFLTVADPSNKARKYKLSEPFADLF